MNDVVSEIGPSDDAAVRVDEFEIEQAIRVIGVGHECDERDLPAVADQERAEIDVLVHMDGTVCVGDRNISTFLAAKEMFDRTADVCDPAHFLFEIRVRVLNHGCVEANSTNEEEPMLTMTCFACIHERHSAHVDARRTVGNHNFECVRDIEWDAEVTGKQVGCSDRDDAESMAGIRQSCCDSANSAITADSNDNLCTALQCFTCADGPILIKTRFQNERTWNALVFAKLEDLVNDLLGTGFGRVHNEGIFHGVARSVIDGAHNLGASVFAEVSPQESGSDPSCESTFEEAGSRKPHRVFELVNIHI